MINIFTYNILSSNLASPTHFTKCNPEYLDAVNRIGKLKELLTPEIKDDSIICLQEVSRHQEEELQPFFQQNNYTFITSLYGKADNGYMGVGIAFSNKKFCLQVVKIPRIADSKKWIPVQKS